MSRTFARVLIALVALAHATFFIIYQSPDWLTEWTDQSGYTRLGRALAETGHLTRYPEYPRFVPDVLRTPGYPVFVAAVNRTIGEGQLPVPAAATLWPGAGGWSAACISRPKARLPQSGTGSASTAGGARRPRPRAAPRPGMATGRAGCLVPARRRPGISRKQAAPPTTSVRK